MILGDLIKEKDYDYIEMRTKIPPEAVVDDDDTAFMGYCKSKNGELLCNELCGFFEKETVVLEYEEWEDSEEGIKNGLTVVYQEGISVYKQAGKTPNL